MAYIIVENFKGGLDTRRSVLASAPGTLSKAENVHVSRGGELEKRKAFVAVDIGVDTEHTHPFEGTYGLESTGDGATVFTTTYATTSWYNPGRWVRFLWLNITDEAGPVQPTQPAKMYVRFQYESTIHEVTLSALSISSERLQIPNASRQADVSFQAPSGSTLINYFTVNIPNQSNECLLVATTDASTNDGRCFRFDLGVLDKYGFMVLNYTNKTMDGTLGSISVSAPPLPSQWNKPPAYWPSPVSSGSYTVALDIDGNPFIRGSWSFDESAKANLLFLRKNGIIYHQISIPDSYNRKSLKTRIETIYTDVKVVEVDHPDGITLTGIVYSTVYGGKSFVLAKFSNGDVLPFYDGKLVGAFVDGVYRASYGSLYNFIESISDLINTAIQTAKDNYTGDSAIDDQIRQYSASTVETVSGTSVTITGPQSINFSADAYIDAPCAFTTEIIQDQTETVDATSATMSFTVAAGTSGAANTEITLRRLNGYEVPPISGIFVTPVASSPSDGIEITGIDRVTPTPIQWPYTGYTAGGAWDANQKLCYAISYIINTNTVNTKISSEYSNYGGGWNGNDPATFSISTTSKMGAAYNGRGVWVEFTTDTNLNPPIGPGEIQMHELIDSSTVQTSPYDAGRFIARLTNSGWEELVSGTLINGTRNSIDSIVSNGVELLSDIDPDTMTVKPDASQYFDTNADQLASDIVSSINHGTGTHNHTATREGARVTISAPSAGTTWNSKPIRIGTSGNVIITGKTGFSGGKDSVPGLSKIVRINFTGTPDVGDKCWIKITDPRKTDIPYKFGATRMAGKKGSFCFTYKGKEYIGVESTLYFSAINSVTKWDIYDSGSGFIDMSNNFGGRESLTGAGVYQNSIAVFTERNCQLWFFDPDPTLNSQHQVLDNTGCIAPNSVVSVGAVDLFYLSYNGVRSLQSRENTDSACTNDIGSAIDEIVIKMLSEMTADERYASKAIIEPSDGRYWITVGGRLFVLSYFRGSSILAWSEYVPGFSVDEMVVFKGRVYIRSGQKVYLYGGNSGNQYDNSQIVVELPYLDANRPAGYKQVVGIDATCEGEWVVQLGFDYTNPSQRDTIAIISQPTFALGRIMATGIGTHIGPRLVSSYNGYCRMANLIVHYDDMHSKHEG
jgi:hypothetical protein